MLQATLFSLQQQQLLQMQILSQMSQRGNSNKESSSESADPQQAEEADPSAAASGPLGVMAELAKKMQLAPTFEEKKQG